MSDRSAMTMHTDADIRGDTYNLTITVQGTQLDVISLIDQLVWAVTDDPKAHALARLRDSIAGTVGLVRVGDSSPRIEDQQIGGPHGRDVPGR